MKRKKDYEYYEKRERAQFNEAKKLAVEYFDRYGKRPGKEVFHEYFMLFETADEAQKNDVFRKEYFRLRRLYDFF